LISNKLDTSTLATKISVQRTLGVPYPNWTPEQIAANVDKQAKAIADDLKAAGSLIAPDKEIIALVAYLQQLGHYQATPVAKPAGAQ
jgi:cytochrome c oxidase cbb3-type subunit I/II